MTLKEILEDIFTHEVSIWDRSEGGHGITQFYIDTKLRYIQEEEIYELIKYGFIINGIDISSHNDIEKVSLIITVSHISGA